MKSLAAFVFPGFQTLDLFGPLEVLGDYDDEVEISIVAENPDPVASYHGNRLVVDKTIAEGSQYDLVLIPGGDTAPIEMKKDPIRQWVIDAAENAELMMAVCTGTILLASTGLLDGRRATTNKKDFTATVPHAPKVEWVPKARWVEDGKFFTSSGVSAGIDMSLAAMARLFGQEVADDIAVGVEYDWHRDPDWDPFAKLAGLL